MGNILAGIFAIIFVVGFVIGGSVNVLIPLVSYRDWVRRRKMASVDQILMALAISRLSLLWVAIVSVLTLFLCPTLEILRHVMRILNTIWVVANHFSLWFATSLSIFYFLKIANFSNSLFLHLKWKVEKVVSMTPLVSLFFLVLNIVYADKKIDVWISRFLTYNSSRENSTQITVILLLSNSVFLLLPFMASLMAFLLLAFSLWKHLKKMQHATTGARDASTMAHVKALRTVMSSLLLYAIFLLSVVIEFLCFMFLGSDLVVCFDHGYLVTFHSWHSLVLILENKKLRQAILLVLSKLKCRAKGLEVSGPS
ncbi:taste receptor type 2 member 125-like [Perognathus longimembris pacificus]|uniref:taste receptor type 2 member 125-like n=1 Tax=Perognathus longimembris pacificus TaxID=214514 RepID=UPI0020196BFE|nr:taste receptor type 2 member 125-like [Perognathus longimembris pacificus]